MLLHISSACPPGLEYNSVLSNIAGLLLEPAKKSRFWYSVVNIGSEALHRSSQGMSLYRKCPGNLDGTSGFPTTWRVSGAGPIRKKLAMGLADRSLKEHPMMFVYLRKALRASGCCRNGWVPVLQKLGGSRKAMLYFSFVTTPEEYLLY